MRPVEGADGDWVIRLGEALFCGGQWGWFWVKWPRRKFGRIGKLGGEEEEKGQVID